MQFLALEHFAGYVGETFTVALDHIGDAPFALVEASPLPVRQVQGMVRAPFSLIFRHEAAILFPQKTYQMTHAALGTFGIFMVPVARDRGGFLYQAVFN